MADYSYGRLTSLANSLPPPPPPPFSVPSPRTSHVSIGLSSQRSTAFSLPSLQEDSEQEAAEEKESQLENRKGQQEGDHEKQVEKEEDEDDEEERHRRIVCCAWMFFGLFAAVFLFLLFFLIYVVILRSALPEISVLRLDFPRLNFSSREHEALLNANVKIRIQVLNKNQKVELEYGRLKVQVSSEDIHLGETMVSGFSQMPNKRRVLIIATKVRKSMVNAETAKILKENAKNKKITIDIVLSGNIGFDAGVIKTHWVPALITCHEINQFDVDMARKPICTVKIFGFR